MSEDGAERLVLPIEAQAHERAEDARTYLYRQDLYGFEGASINHKPRKIIDELLKNMSVTRSFWGVLEIVSRTFESWRPILWSEINTEKLSEACKDFARDVKAFGKQNAEVTTWEMFTRLTAKVSNMAPRKLSPKRENSSNHHREDDGASKGQMIEAGGIAVSAKRADIAV